jgi:segregation and condensation protein A
MNNKDIKLEQFEGPLVLLLELIEQEQLDITDLSLAKVTDQYIAILEAQTELHPEEIADFLLVAAKLLYLKSKVLSPDYFTDEPVAETDLARQLRLYQEYVQVAKKLQQRWRNDNYFYSRLKPWRLPKPKFIPPNNISLDTLPTLMIDVLAQLEPIVKLKIKKMKNTVSIKERIEYIKNYITQKTSFAWHDLIEQSVSKTERIVSFLAVLELVKQREVEVYQETIFANFIVKKNNKT